MFLLASLDRGLKPLHVVLANVVALGWFITVSVEARLALPSAALVRCPMGFCAGGYSPEELYSMLDEIGVEGRTFLYDTMLSSDLVLPALFLIALVLDIVWFSRTGARFSVPLDPIARLALVAVPFLYCIADYMENVALAETLRLYPAIEDVMAERLSTLTAAKSQLFAAAAGIAAALAIAACGLGVRSGPRPPAG
ncbi:MAG: hypothetical protein EKK41_26215 [Hyphomicrobiales bacterium]|nr:MAG: hypothetical protein EKK41_26215 [Hyphomicrobiales bacterium]